MSTVIDYGGLPPHVCRALDQIAADEKLGSGYQVEHSAGSQHGQGFSATLLAITLTAAGGLRSLSLICKLQLPIHSDSATMGNGVIFAREAEMYTNILPMMAQLQRRHGLTVETGFFAYPKCYYAKVAANNESIIVLENLRDKGFGLVDKTKHCTIEQIELLVRQLARYNGLSFVLRDQQPEEFARFFEFSDVHCDLMQNNKAMNAYYSTSLEKSVEVVESEDDKQLMRSMLNRSMTLLRTRQSADRLKRFGVLSHGDCHINNVMYTSESSDHPSEIMILDWQVSSIQSPAIDLSNFVFASTDKAMRDKHYDVLLRMYHEELSRVVKVCGSDAGALFSFGDLVDQMREFGADTMVYMTLVLPYLLTPSEEMVNISDLVENEDSDDASKKTIAPLKEDTEILYRQRLTDIIVDFRRLGLIPDVKEE